MANIRAFLLAPAKTVEERVTVEIDPADGAATILLDGKFQAVFLREKRLANALRLGLIATLKSTEHAGDAVPEGKREMADIKQAAKWIQEDKTVQRRSASGRWWASAYHPGLFVGDKLRGWW